MTVKLQLLGGATGDERAAMKLKSIESYRYLSASSCVSVSGVNDKDEFKAMREAMTAVGFAEERQVCERTECMCERMECMVDTELAGVHGLCARMCLLMTGRREPARLCESGRRERHYTTVTRPSHDRHTTVT